MTREEFTVRVALLGFDRNPYIGPQYIFTSRVNGRLIEFYDNTDDQTHPHPFNGIFGAGVSEYSLRGIARGDYACALMRITELLNARSKADENT